jgi:hypothetical protein
VIARARLIALAALALGVLASTARADTITVGMFAPSAPFDGTAARVDYVNKLAGAVGAALGKDGIGRVYGRASDFAAALMKGEVLVAVVAARYLAIGGAGAAAVVAVAQRTGEPAAPWQLMTRTARTVLDLRGKTVLVPAMGGREGDFVRNALYDGELARDFFGRIEAAPDTASALASLGVGKADAALVPGGVAAPAGVQVIATLPAVSWPVVVVAGLDDAARAKVVAALTTFAGGGALPSFRRADADVVHALAHRMVAPEKRGLMVVPEPRVGVAELVAARRFAIPRTDVKALVAVPAAR